MRGGFGRFLAVAICAASIDARAIATNWSVVDLTPEGPGYAAAVSPGGIVVGCRNVGSTETRPFVYANGSRTDLAAPAGATSCATAVNDHGLIAGAVNGELTLWQGGVARDLGVRGYATGMSDQGVVVGGLEDGTTNSAGGRNTRAFLWSNGVFTDLGTPSGRAYAIGINHANQVAVFANGELFLYQNGTLRDLGASVDNAYGFDDRGEIVGMTSFGHGPQEFIYDGTVHSIAGAPGDGGAVAINNAGQVLASGEGIYGTLVEAGRFSTLDTLASLAGGSATTTWHHMEGKAINDRGWIVGQGGASDFHAFLLMPKDASSAAPTPAANPAARMSARTWPLIRVTRAP
jgi:probable HAF family extracellular repeat protein